MELTYKKAGADDIERLIDTRIQVLIAANKLEKTTNMYEVRRQTRDYYQKALEEQSHTAYLVFDQERFAGAGGVSFYRVMPTYHNPSGDKAYIMNMYTEPAYRRRGIAFHTLDLLVGAARARGIDHITLEATDMGRPLYERYGFIKMQDEMKLPGSAGCISGNEV